MPSPYEGVIKRVSDGWRNLVPQRGAPTPQAPAGGVGALPPFAARLQQMTPGLATRVATPAGFCFRAHNKE